MSRHEIFRVEVYWDSQVMRTLFLGGVAVAIAALLALKGSEQQVQNLDCTPEFITIEVGPWEMANGISGINYLHGGVNSDADVAAFNDHQVGDQLEDGELITLYHQDPYCQRMG